MTLIAETKSTQTTRSRKATKEIRLALTNADGVSYEGRFEGIALALHVDWVEVYRTNAGNVVLYDTRTSTLSVVENPEEDLRGVLCNETYIEALAALGICATVDLDV